MPGYGQVRCHVSGTISDSVEIKELVICRYDEDPRNAQYIPIVTGNEFSCEIESDEVYKYKIIDIGEILEQGHTNRWGEFYAEDKATIDIMVGEDEVSVNSTGEQFRINESMKESAMEIFMPKYAELESLPDSLRDNREKILDDEYSQWMLNYHASHPSLEFLFDLHNRLSYFHLMDKQVKTMLGIYNNYNFADLYPEHSIHQKIAELSQSGLQITGGDYHDYCAFDLNMKEIKASEFILNGNPTVVIMWATWCSPCRRDALDMIPIYEKYHDLGVNFIGLAREFKSADDIRSVVEKDKHPWPTVIDIDDKFEIFKKHGVTSSGFYLIDRNGKVVTAAYDFKDIEPELNKLL